MSEDRLTLTREMLDILNQVRKFCGETDSCIECPFHLADNPYGTCRLSWGFYPMSWDVDQMEVGSNG